MLICFKKKQLDLVKSILFVVSIILVEPLCGMIMEQFEYTVLSNAADIKVSF
jgi:hypothetical protein